VLRHLGGDSGSMAAGIGTIVHDAAHEIAGSGEPLEVLRARITHDLRERWPELEFESDWIERREWIRAEAIADRLAIYQAELVAAGGGTLASETRLRYEVERAVLSGRIDRVERVVEDGVARAVVVDFKTGVEAKALSPAQLAAHPQLATYQLALAAGAIEGIEPGAMDGLELGGARLVVLAPKATRTVRQQPQLDDAGMLAWSERIAGAAEGMSGRTFVAYADSHCLGWGSGGLCPIHIVEAVTS
jgi:RecB family exonuclease